MEHHPRKNKKREAKAKRKISIIVQLTKSESCWWACHPLPVFDFVFDIKKKGGNKKKSFLLPYTENHRREKQVASFFSP